MKSSLHGLVIRHMAVHTKAEAAAHFGVTHQAIHQMETKIFRKLSQRKDVVELYRSVFGRYPKGYTRKTVLKSI